MNVLILVDIQYDFLKGGALEVPYGEAIIPLVNDFQDHFDLVVATQDWHPPGHKSFASAHENKQPFDQITLNGLEQTLWPDHCVQGSAGAEFHRELQMQRVEAIIRKGMDVQTDSYSGFYDNGHIRSTGLAGYLRERGAGDIYVCGLAGDYCVYYTARDALRENFKTLLIEDATRPISEEGFEKAKEDLRAHGGKIVSSKDLLL